MAKKKRPQGNPAKATQRWVDLNRQRIAWLRGELKELLEGFDRTVILEQDQDEHGAELEAMVAVFAERVDGRRRSDNSPIRSGGFASDRDRSIWLTDLMAYLVRLDEVLAARPVNPQTTYASLGWGKRIARAADTIENDILAYFEMDPDCPGMEAQLHAIASLEPGLESLHDAERCGWCTDEDLDSDHVLTVEIRMVDFGHLFAEAIDQLTLWALPHPGDLRLWPMSETACRVAITTRHADALKRSGLRELLERSNAKFTETLEPLDPVPLAAPAPTGPPTSPELSADLDALDSLATTESAIHYRPTHPPPSPATRGQGRDRDSAEADPAQATPGPRTPEGSSPPASDRGAATLTEHDAPTQNADLPSGPPEAEGLSPDLSDTPATPPRSSVGTGAEHAPERVGKPRAAGGSRLQQALIAEAMEDHLSTGLLPSAQRWAQLPDRPTADVVLAVFGSFDALCQAAGLGQSVIAERDAALTALSQRLGEAEERAAELHARAEALQDELQRNTGDADRAEQLAAEAQDAQRRLAAARTDAQSAAREADELRVALRTAQVAERARVSDLEAQVARARADAEEAKARAETVTVAAEALATHAATDPRNQTARARDLGRPLYRLWLPLSTIDHAAAVSAIEAAARWVSRARNVQAARPESLRRQILEVLDTRAEVPAGGRAQISVEHQRTDEDLLWQLTLRHPDDRDPQTNWHTHLTVARTAENAFLGLEVGILRPGAPMRPARIPFVPPRLAREWTELAGARDAGRLIGHRPQLIDTPEAAGAFSDFLLAPDRGRPVIYASCQLNRGVLVDTQALAGHAAGLAHVAQSASAEIDQILNELQPTLRTYHGAVRTFWPRPEELENPVMGHDLISRLPPQTVVQRLLSLPCEISVGALTAPPALEQIRSRITRKRAQDELAAARARTEHARAGGGPAMSGEPSDEWLEEHEQALARAEELAEENAQLVEQAGEIRGLADRQEQLIADLQKQLAVNRSTTPTASGDTTAPQAELGSLTAALNRRLEFLPDDSQLPDVLAAVRWAAAACQHLTITDQARQTAQESPYRSPRTVAEDLAKLDVLAELYLRPGGFGARPADAAREINLDYVETSRAAKRARREYTLTHKGRSYLMEPHVRVGGRAPGAGKFARIYLCLHEGDEHLDRSVLIGHVGRHLPDSTT